MECLDLRTLYENKFLLIYDHAIDTKGKHRKKIDPWLIMLDCRLGTIYPHGGTTLAADIEGDHKTLRNKIVKLGGALVRDTDEGTTVLFDHSQFKEVAKIMKPKRRRKLTPKKKAQLSKLNTESKLDVK